MATDYDVEFLGGDKEYDTDGSATGTQRVAPPDELRPFYVTVSDVQQLAEKHNQLSERVVLVDDTPVPGGLARWNEAGTQVVYTTSFIGGTF